MGMIGFYSTFIYVVLGVLGLPLFANGGGILHFLQHLVFIRNGNFSFMIAYILKSEVNTGLIKLSATILAGAFVIFLCRISHLSFYVGIEQAINLGLLPFLYSEFLKIVLAIAIIFGLIQELIKKS